MTQPIPISASTRMMWLWLLFLAATGLCLLALGVRAEVPLRIEYQGVADDGFGQPLNGTATIGLSLWDDPLAGVQIFSETHSGVAVVDGVFTVEIGGTIRAVYSVFQRKLKSGSGGDMKRLSKSEELILPNSHTT